MKNLVEDDPTLVIIAALAKSVTNSYEAMNEQIQIITSIQQMGGTVTPEQINVGRVMMDMFAQNLDALRTAADNILNITTDELPDENKEDTCH